MPNLDVTNLSGVLGMNPEVSQEISNVCFSEIDEERAHDLNSFTNKVQDEENVFTCKMTREGYGCQINNLNNDVYNNNLGSRSDVKNPANSAGKRERANYYQIMSVVSGFIVNLFAGGIPNCNGIMYTYMKEPLGVTEEELSWIGSLMSGFIGIASIVGMLCLESLGARRTTLLGGVLATTGFIIGSQIHNLYVLYLTLGVLPGMGICLAYTANMVNVNTQFTKWRPLAVGVSITGLSVGMLIWPPMSSFTADRLGWQGVFLINGALTLHFIPCAMWIPPCNAIESSSGQNFSLSQTLVNCFQIFRIPGAVTVSIAHFTLGFSYYTFSTFIPEYVTTTMFRLTTSQAAVVVTTPGYGSMAGRLIFSGVSMATERAAKYILLSSICVMGVTNLLTPLCGFSGVFPLVFVQLFGLQNLSKAFGMFMMCLGLGAFGGSPIQSYLSTIYDKATPFYLAGGSFIVTMMLMLSVVMRKQMVFCTSTTKSDSQDVEGVDNRGFSTGTPDTVV